MNKPILFLFLFAACKLFSQESDTLDAHKLRVFPLPVIYYTPETEFAFGAVSLFTFRLPNEPAESRTSQFQLGGAYTQRDQMLFYMPYQVYWKNQKRYVFGELYYYKYSYRFFGVGSDLPDENEELYNVNFPRIRFNYMTLVKPDLYMGMRYWFDNYKITKVKEGGLLDAGNITGSDGGVISSLGFISLYDNRDNYNFPRSGNYLEVLALANNKYTGSDFDFARLSVDYVKFLSYKKNILALNFYGVSLIGDPPFNEMALIGGRSKMRGFFEGRYRDKNLLMAQAEYRRFLFWKLGMVAFLGYGVVADTPGELAVDQVKGSGGLGLRFLLNPEEKINIRLDYGIGEGGSSGIYLTIGEAF